MAFPADKKNKRWIWKAYDRDSRRCVSWVVGGRDHVTFGRLWERIARPGCIYCTDNWSVYSEVIPPGQHVVSKAATQLLESDNAKTRHRVARFTRRTKVVSRSEKMIDLTMRLWAYFEQGLHFDEYQKKVMCILG